MSWQIIIAILLSSVPLQLLCSLIGQNKKAVAYLPALVFFIGILVCVLAILMIKDSNLIPYIILLITFVVVLIVSLILMLVFGRWLKERKAAKF